MAESKPPRDLPQVPDSVDPSIRRPLARVIEEVQRLLEFRGDPLDAALTTRKAIARGLLDNVGRALTGNVTYVNTFPSTSGGGGGGTTPDLTPPPTVAGLTVVAGFTQVIVQFDAPVYTQGHGNLQTNIYASKKATTDPTMPTFGDAVLVFSAPGALNIVSIPSEINTRWHVWAKYKTVDGVESVTAAGGTNGVIDTTGQDIVQLLEVLTGSIREGQLYAALAEPIRSIVRRADDAAEDALRGALGTHEATKRAVSGLLAEAAARGTSILQTQVLIAEGDSQLAAQISLLQATVNDPDTGVGATAAALDTVETLVNNGSTGVTALASRTSTLEARVTTPSATPGDPAYNVTYAGLVTEQSARAALDGSVQALYTVRAEVSAGGSTMVGGFGLSATSTFGGGSTIDFGVIANRFYVGAPNDGSAPGIGNVLPFIVQASATTINGVSVPAGVYMDTAFIRNGTIVNAKIGDAAIDNAKVANLSAAKLTVGDGTVGGNLKSTSYTAGSGSTPGTGWLLTPGGDLRGSNVILYGTVYASAGVFAGSLSAATGTFSGSLSAASGSFTGSLSGANITGATGTFSGSLNINSGGADRMEITSTRIKIFNGGVERVRLGDLS